MRTLYTAIPILYQVAVDVLQSIHDPPKVVELTLFGLQESHNAGKITFFLRKTLALLSQFSFPFLIAIGL